MKLFGFSEIFKGRITGNSGSIVNILYNNWHGTKRLFLKHSCLFLKFGVIRNWILTLKKGAEMLCGFL